MESAHIEHDLFLLMMQLSQIHDPGLIRRVFVESVNALDPDLRIEFSDSCPVDIPEVIAVATAKRVFAHDFNHAYPVDPQKDFCYDEATYATE
jgi:hypothetical protein